MLFLLLTIACSAGLDDTAEYQDPCIAGTRPVLDLGIGELNYNSLEQVSEQAELIHGPQGGYHINVALQAKRLDPSTPWLARLTGSFDGAPLGTTQPYVTMRCNTAAEALQAWGLLLIWDEGTLPVDIVGRQADIQVELTDSAGTEMSATGQVTIIDDIP